MGATMRVAGTTHASQRTANIAHPSQQRRKNPCARCPRLAESNLGELPLRILSGILYYILYYTPARGSRPARGRLAARLAARGVLECIRVYVYCIRLYFNCVLTLFNGSRSAGSRSAGSRLGSRLGSRPARGSARGRLAGAAPPDSVGPGAHILAACRWRRSRAPRG